MAGLPDRIQPHQETVGDEVIYRFANGLVIRTEVFHKRDPMRILPLGSPQFAIMNRLANRPETVAGRRVLEPFAGSGPLGFMALAAGARHVDFVDLNPRARDFHRDNASRNEFPPDAYGSFVGDIADFEPAEPYDLLLANPPFVPTPPGLVGTLTSNGGPEGNDLARILLERLPRLLAPGGEAVVYLLQIDVGGEPLVGALAEPLARTRPVQLIPSQRVPIPFAIYCDAYHRLFPEAGPAIDAWSHDLLARHGEALSLRHYIVHVGPSTAPAGLETRDDFAEMFGDDFLVPSEKPEELAIGRVFENRVPAD